MQDAALDVVDRTAIKKVPLGYGASINSYSRIPNDDFLPRMESRNRRTLVVAKARYGEQQRAATGESDLGQSEKVRPIETVW